MRRIAGGVSMHARTDAQKVRLCLLERSTHDEKSTLFDIGSADLEESLNSAFESWVAHRADSRSRTKNERALSAESVNVYREMWQAFAKFCAERNLHLRDMTVPDLETFLTIRGTGPDPGQPRQTTRGGYLSERYAKTATWCWCRR